ncbi:MAG: flagellar type III secretion system pore protein FliP [Planctomycetaceae bacterium]|nr:flagellar type III secretion system pore protein FliP [Planctomycetaceae bacterium]
MGACLIALACFPSRSALAQTAPDRQPRPVSASTRPGEKGGLNLLDGAKDATKPEHISTTLEIALVLTVLSIAPAILVMMTSFTRIVIVLSFVRRALGTQELPPNQVLTGLSLFLTFMVMTPTLTAIKRDALDPYTTPVASQQISQSVAFQRAEGHLREFMFHQARVQDVRLFMDITKQPRPKDGEKWMQDDVPTTVLIPSFMISELRRAFIMGFALFLPFLVIDLVVSAALLSMGMMVLPPFLISLPFKILLFVVVDGWHLVVGSVVQSFFHG